MSPDLRPDLELTDEGIPSLQLETYRTEWEALREEIEEQRILLEELRRAGDLAPGLYDAFLDSYYPAWIDEYRLGINAYRRIDPLEGLPTMNHIAALPTLANETETLAALREDFVIAGTLLAYDYEKLDFYTPPEGQLGGVFYDADQIRDLLDYQKENLLALFHSNERDFRSLKGYIDQAFPTLDPGEIVAPKYLEFPAVAAGVVLEIFDKLWALMDSVANATRRTMDLDVRSTPDEASFVIRHVDDTDVVSSVTNTTVRNLYLGAYKVTFQLPGLPPLQHKFETVRDNRPILMCTLSGSTPGCKREE